MKSQKFALLIIVLFFFAGGCTPENNSMDFVSGDVQESKIQTGPPKGGDFRLQSADGPVTLHDLQGKVVLLFFGYTSCPDVCPATLHIMSDAFSRLSIEELKNVQGIFIGIDPERDTIEGLKEYSSYFHENIIGATGDVGNLKKTAEAYGAFFIKSVTKKDDDAYAFSHSTEIYLIDKKGSLSAIYSDETNPRSLSESIRRLLLQS